MSTIKQLNTEPPLLGALSPSPAAVSPQLRSRDIKFLCPQHLQISCLAVEFNLQRKVKRTATQSCGWGMNEKYYASAHQFIMWATFSEEQHAKLFHIILLVPCPPAWLCSSPGHIVNRAGLYFPPQTLAIFRPTFASPGPGPGLVSPRASF